MPTGLRAHPPPGPPPLRRRRAPEEASVVYAPYKFHLCAHSKSACEGGVSTTVGEICPICFGDGEEVATFGCVVKGCDGGG
jgi:hypothetical protein